MRPVVEHSSSGPSGAIIQGVAPPSAAGQRILYIQCCRAIRQHHHDRPRMFSHASILPMLCASWLAMQTYNPQATLQHRQSTWLEHTLQTELPKKGTVAGWPSWASWAVC